MKHNNLMTGGSFCERRSDTQPINPTTATYSGKGGQGKGDILLFILRKMSHFPRGPSRRAGIEYEFSSFETELAFNDESSRDHSTGAIQRRPHRARHGLL